MYMYVYMYVEESMDVYEHVHICVCIYMHSHIDIDMNAGPLVAYGDGMATKVLKMVGPPLKSMAAPRLEQTP